MPGITQYAGGFLLDSGVHFVAPLRKVVGEIEKVSGSVSQRLPYMPPADSVTALLSFAGGAEGAYRLSFAAPSAIGDQGLRLIGTKGTLLAGLQRFRKLDLRHNWVRVQTGTGRRFIPVTDDLWAPAAP
jgi:predicted dehydrogenase